MKFLVCQRMEKEQPGSWADDGDVVIPNFPTGPQNTFVSVVSCKPAYYARVADVADMTLDDTLPVLRKDYPGLPVELLATYLLETAAVADKLPVGTIVQVYITYDKAEIVVKGGGDRYVLWTKQPIPENYLG